MRLLTGALDIFGCEPHNDLLHRRSWNEAYCTAKPGEAYAVFFPDGGDIRLDVSAVGDKRLTVRWLNIRHGEWVGVILQTVEGADFVDLVTPTEDGYWTALVSV
jgi:hypothetical protein